MDSKRIAAIVFILLFTCSRHAVALQRGIKEITLPVQVTAETSPVRSMTVSRDGRQMVIASDREGFTDLWTLSADPRQVILPERLTSDPSTETDPAFSPDGTLVAYTGTGYDVKGDIYIIDLTDKGAGPIRLTDRDTEDGGACFTPDGDAIYFHRKFPGSHVSQLARLDLKSKSGDIQVLETNCDASFPSVSPDGGQVCFVNYDKGPSGDIRLFDIRTKTVRQLTGGPFFDFSPVWSGDGRTIFFSRISRDTDGDGSISVKDGASAYRIHLDDDRPRVYPVSPENEHLTNLVIADGKLFYISDRLSTIPNGWFLPQEGMIPRQKNSDKQMEFAEVMGRYIPNPFLNILLFYAVPENFPDRKDNAAHATYLIGKTYRKEKMAPAAYRMFDDVITDYKASEPFYSLSLIEKIAVDTELKMDSTADDRKKEAIVDAAVEHLQGFFASNYPIVSARAGIEASKLLQKAGGADRLLAAIQILGSVETAERTGRPEIAEAMVLKAGIYDKIGGMEQVYPVYMSVIHDYPDQTEPAGIAVENILDKTMVALKHESFNRKIERLIRIADENTDKAPLLAMGALNRAGDLYYIEDRWAPAKDVYRRVLDEFPTAETQTAAARFSLAEILFREERFREALKLYEKEISLRPAEDRVRQLARQGYIRKSVAAGEYLFKLGEVLAAQSRFSDLIEYDHGIVEAHRGYIKCAAALGLMDKTLKKYRLHLQDNPSDPVAVYCVGLCLTYLDDRQSLAEARQLLTRSVNMDGQVEYFHQTLGYVFEVFENVYSEKGGLEKALESYKKAYFLNNPEFNPENTANLLLNVGNTYFSLGRFRNAFALYKDLQATGKVFENKNREILFYRRLGMAAFQINENAESIGAFKKTLELINSEIDATDVLDDAGNGRLEGMKAEVLDRLGLAFQENGEYEAAADAFEKVSALNHKLGFKQNLALNRRSVAFNQYKQAEMLFGEEKINLLSESAENFVRAIALADQYGVPDKKSESGGGLIGLDLQVALDKTASTSAGHGFTLAQEKRLAEAFLSRIYLELGRLGPAEASLEKQLAAYPEGAKIADSDVFGVSLLLHRAGLVANSRKDFSRSFDYFRRSAELCIRMKSNVSTALNVSNMAHAFRRMAAVKETAGRYADQTPGVRMPGEHLRRLAVLDESATRLFNASDFASEGPTEAIYHNSMGVFWTAVGKRFGGTPADAVRQFDYYQKAMSHFSSGIKALEGIQRYGKRRKTELRATICLNTARTSECIGEGAHAKQYYEKVLEIVDGKGFPDLEWRALAGLRQYDDALSTLETVMITRAGCEGSEIMETFGSQVVELAEQGDVEEAFNMMERLSEIERFNRTAFIFRTACESTPDFYRELYPRLMAIEELKAEMDQAEANEKDYFKKRISDEEELVRLKTGDKLEKLPDVIGMVADKNTRERLIVLLGIACHAEAMADRMVEAVEQPSAARYRDEYDRLSLLYQEKREDAYFSRAETVPADIFTLLGPEPFEAVDVMDALADGEMVVRLFHAGSAHADKDEKPVCRFVVDMDGIEYSAHAAYRDALDDMPLDDDGSAYLVCENPRALAQGLACAFNTAHFMRSVMNRQPFKENLLSLPALTGLPEGYEEISEPQRMNTLVVAEKLRIAGSVPVRAGNRPTKYPVIDVENADRRRLESYIYDKPGLSLALFADIEPGDIYLLGHLSAIYGCPSVMLSLDGEISPAFMDRFMREYKDTSALDAKVIAGEMTGGEEAGVVLLGYEGMQPEEARRFASKRFADYVKKGKAAFDAGSYPNALGYFEDAVKIARQNEIYNRYMSSLYRYARESAYMAGQLPEAARFAEMLSKTLEENQPDTAGHASSLLYQGLIYAKQETYDKALPVMEEAVDIFENLEADSEKDDAMASLGTVLENASKYEQALEYFSSVAVPGLRKNKSGMTAAQYRNMGRIYDLRLSRYPVAITYYQKALSLYREMEDLARTAESLLNIGRCHRLMGNFNAADTFYAEAEKIADKTPDDKRLMAEIVIEQANSAWFGARYEKAFRYQRKALAMARENNMPELEVISLNTSGLIWWALGNYTKAMREFEGALTVAEEDRIRKDEVATTYNNMGLVFRETGRYDKALDAFDKALGIDRELKSRWAIAYDLRNKGLTWLQIGNAEKALPMFAEAVSEAHAIGNRINEAKALLGLGMAYAETGDAGASEKAFQQALRLSDEMSMPETGWRSLFGLAKLKLSEPGEAAENLLKRAVKKIEAMRADLKIDKLKESFVDNKLSVYRTLVQLLADRGSVVEAFEIAERSRARNFIDLLGNQQISMKNSTEKELYERQAFLKTEISQTQKLLSVSRDDEERRIYSKRLESLNNDYDDVMLDIQASNPQLASFVSVTPLNAETLIAELDPGVALLAYYMVFDELFCWIVKPGGGEDAIQLVRSPLNVESFEKDILEYRRRIQNLEPLIDQSRRLYNTVMANVTPYLGDVKKLAIIPHGSLHYLSFATLSNGERYLIDDYSLFYLPSASIYTYTKTRRKATKNTKVLAIGNPDLDSEALDLPFAEHEVESIRWNFPDITVLTGERATESWVVDNINRFGIIHLATHGEFDAVNPLFSVIMLSKGEERDGNLETSEVFGLDIQADMIVLSACQTGLGKITGGDDVIGLNRAFFYAGTHTIISSLWRVSDVSTAVLIKAFYRRYRIYDKADSLRLAILHVKNNYPHPGYWGAFTLSGDYY